MAARGGDVARPYRFIILLYLIGVLCSRQDKKIIIFPIETFPDYVKVKLCLSALFLFSSLFEGPHLASNTLITNCDKSSTRYLKIK